MSNEPEPIGSPATPALIIRLGEKDGGPVEIEPGYMGAGAGYKKNEPLTDTVDATRAWWEIDLERVKREGIKHAVAVYQKVSIAVMEIDDVDSWLQRDGDDAGGPPRRAFGAKAITSGPIFDQFVGKNGKRFEFKKGDRSPVRYWPFVD